MDVEGDLRRKRLV